MRPADFLLPAWRQFRTQRLQALLITVAIALGVSVIVAIAAQVQTANRMTQNLTGSAQREVNIVTAANRSSVLSLAEGRPAVRQVGYVDDEPVVFTLQDLEAARFAIPSAAYIYFMQFSGMTREVDGNMSFVDVRAVTEDFFAASGFELQHGSYFSSTDYESDARLLLVTPAFLEMFELPDNSSGTTVELEGVEWFIAGIIAPADTDLDFGFGPIAYMPLTLAQLNRSGSPDFVLVAADAAELNALRAETEAFATATWGRRTFVEGNAVLAAASAQSNNTIRLVIAGFASLGLLVAALNIMNLMLARVLRREREIGINRSFGATRTVIALQILAEALALGLLGGLLGIAAGYGLLHAYNTYMRVLMGDSVALQALTVTLPWGAALLGVALAIAVSLLFGLYPALMAARVQPVAALRRL